MARCERLDCDREAQQRRSHMGPAPKYCSVACAEQAQRAAQKERDPYYHSRRHWMRKKQWIDYLGGGCSCGERRLPCLDFDHRDPKTKCFEISVMLRSAGQYTDQELQAEVDKCQVQCTNCHRIKSAKHWADLADLFQ